jgi:hypothetical protein
MIAQVSQDMTVSSAASPVSSSLRCSVPLALALVYKVRDVATGIGVAAETAIEAVGPSGTVVAADLSPGDKSRSGAKITVANCYV